jgi:hypothetical protein
LAGTGTTKSRWQAGQIAFLPACSSFARKAVPQAHVNEIAIGSAPSLITTDTS